MGYRLLRCARSRRHLSTGRRGILALKLVAHLLKSHPLDAFVFVDMLDNPRRHERLGIPMVGRDATHLSCMRMT